MKNMNRIFSLLLLFLFTQLHAQKTEKYFDYRWNECKPNVARFYRQIIKTDSGYCRKDYYLKERKLNMMGNFKDSLLKIKTGKFHYFHANGYPGSFGKYVNDKKEGLWLSYHDNKVKADSTVYLHDRAIGKSLSWYPNRNLSDSAYTNADGSGVTKSWFDNRSVSSTGQYAAGHKKQGLWKYYHLNGKISSLETFIDSELIDLKYFDENGNRIAHIKEYDRYPEFPGGESEWLKFLDKNIYFPLGYGFTNGDMATVVVTFTINESGRVEDVFVSTSFDKNFDQIAVEAVSKSPRWIPAVEHNRKVKYIYSQAINFKIVGDF